MEEFKYISHIRSKGIPVFASSFSINGTYADINFQYGISASSFSADLQAGIVTLFGLDSQQVYVQTRKGDIAIITNFSHEIHYTTKQNGICIAADNVTHLRNDCMVHLMDNSSVSCTASALACATPNDMEEGVCCLKNVVRSATLIADGAIFFNVGITREAVSRQGNLQLNNDTFGDSFNVNNASSLLEYETFVGSGLQDGVKVDILGRAAILLAKNWLDEDPESDAVIMIDTQRSLGIDGKWLYATNTAYLFMEPWLLSTMSLGFVKPRFKEIQARIIPNQCPFVGAIQAVDSLGFISETLREELEATATQGFALKQERVVDGTLHVLKRMFQKIPDGRFSEEILILSNRPSLVAAIFISLVLSAIVGVLVSLQLYKSWYKFRHTVFIRLTAAARYTSLKRKVTSYEYNDPFFKEKFRQNAGKKAASDSATLFKGMVIYPYILPDLLQDMFVKGRINSLRQFLIEHKQQYDSFSHNKFKHNDDLVIPLRDFKAAYEEYCYHRGYFEQSLNSAVSKAVRRSFGILSTAVQDNSTDAFRRIRFANDKESTIKDSYVALPNENSLLFFIRKRCVITPFACDFILARDFTRAYEEFCKNNANVNSIPVTKRAMKAEGVQFERMRMVVWRFSGDFRIDLNVDVEHKMRDLEKAPETESLLWMITDVFTVAFHLVWCTFLPLPLFIFSLFIQTEWNQTAIIPFSVFPTLTINNAITYPSSLPLMLSNMMPQSVILLVVVVVFLLLMGVELLLYYATQQFDTLNQTKCPHSILRGWLHKGCKVGCLVIIASYASIFGMCIIWFILSAVLNPNVYLPYASAAATLIGVSIAKVRGMLQDVQLLQNMLLSSVTKEMEKNMVDILMSEYYESAGVKSGTVGSSVDSTIASIVLSDKNLNTMLNEVKMSVPHAIAIARGDRQATESFAEHLGINPVILRAVVAVARKDDAQTQITELSSVPGVNVSAETALVLFRLAIKQEEHAMKLAIKTSAIFWNKYGVTRDREFSTVSPHSLECITSIAHGDISRFVALLSKSVIVQNSTEYKTAQILQILSSTSAKGLGTGISQYLFSKACKNLGVNVLKIPSVPAQAVVDFYRCNYESNSIDTFAASLRNPVSPQMLYLLTTIATSDRNNFRKYGPGSTLFAELTRDWADVSMECMAGLTALSRSLIVDLDSLQRHFGIPMDVVESLAHIISPYYGKGCAMIGLRASQCGQHLKWIRSQTGISNLVGMFSYAQGDYSKKSRKDIVLFIEEVLQRARFKDKYWKYIIAIAWINMAGSAKDLRSAFDLVCLSDEIPVEMLLLVRGELSWVSFLQNKSALEKLGLHKEDLEEQPFTSTGGSLLFPGAREFPVGATVDDLKTMCDSFKRYVRQQKSISKKKRKMIRGFINIATKCPIDIFMKILKRYMPCGPQDKKTIWAMLSLCRYLQLNRVQRLWVTQQLERLFDLSGDCFDGLLLVALSSKIIVTPETRPQMEQNRQEAVKKIVFSLRDTGFDGKTLDRVYDFTVACQEHISLACKSMDDMSVLAAKIGFPEQMLSFIVRFWEPVVSSELDKESEKSLKDFLREFGISPSIIESLMGLACQDPTKFRALEKAAGLPRGVLETACKLFGDTR